LWLGLTVGDWIQLITAGAALLAATVAIWQSRMTKQQMDATMRPWIGVHEVNPMENEIRIILHNYGSLPTLAMDSRTVGNAAPITVEEVLYHTRRMRMFFLPVTSRRMNETNIEKDTHIAV
jgi:hypothetical protein